MTTLVGIHAKLRRAEYQIRKTTSEAGRLCGDVRQSIVREVRKEVDEQVWVYRGEMPDAPVEWSVIFGEILYNLRSALDHLVWQLVLANGQTPGRHNGFPIATDHQRWQDAKDRQLKGISQRHEAMIGYLQPYTGGINLPFDVSMLRVLNDLSNMEKHRHLIVAVIASKGVEPIMSGVEHPELDDSITSPPFKGVNVLGKVETGKVLLRFNNADTEIRPSFQVDLCFGNSAPPRARASPVPLVLEKCFRTVEGSVEFLTTPMGNGFVDESRP